MKGPLYNFSTLNPIKGRFIQNQFYAFDCDDSRARCRRNAAITASVHGESTIFNHHDVINELATGFRAELLLFCKLY